METPYRDTMLYASLGIEAIGDDWDQQQREFRRMSQGHPAGALLAQAMGETRGPRAWVARLTGLHPTYGFTREFLRGQRDYSRANSKGSRGVYLYYALPPGLYEVSEPLSWKQTRRYFVRSSRGTYEEISREEVIACLST